MDFKYAIAYILIIAISIALSRRFIAKRRSNKKSSLIKLNSFTKANSVRSDKKVIFPPIVDSTALRIQAVLLLVTAIIFKSNEWFIHSTPFNTAMEYIFPFLIISTTATMIVTALYRLYLASKYEK